MNEPMRMCCVAKDEKIQALGHLAASPRLASVDSYAWDVQARWDALKGGYSNTLAHRAGCMGRWYAKHLDVVIAGLDRPELDF